uniref:BTB domain-containing protein n=1 Tax=Syphacia muris TaxID=451379 RepID=A0A158R588_9BILA
MLNQADDGSLSGSSNTHPSTSANSPLIFQNSCTTKVKPLLLSQQWKIENFVPVMKFALPGQCLRSNLFRDQMLPEAFWQLCLYPGGKRAENANHVSLFLKMSSTSPTREVRIKVEYRFYFLSENGSPLFSNVNVGEFHAKPPKGGHSWGLRNIPRQKKRKDNVPNLDSYGEFLQVLNCVRSDGSLMVSCRIELIPDISRIRCVPTDESDSTMPKKMVCSEYFKRQETALNSGNMADCTLECNGQVIQVNKFVLSTHSEVFKAMFAHEEFLENKEAKVVIKDTDIDSVRMMVRFMYCGDISFSSNVEGVMMLAERYQISELKEMCEQFLCSRVNKYNALEMYDLADMYNCYGLKEAVVCTVQKNKDFILNFPPWESFKETNPRLMNELMEQVVRGIDYSPPPFKRQRFYCCKQESCCDD